MYLRSTAFILTAILTTVLAACSHSQAHSNANVAPQPPSVTVAAVISRPLHRWEELTGDLQAVNSVEVRPRVSGFIDSVQFTE
jgi:multidrug efflux system membrane fusion protein